MRIEVTRRFAQRPEVVFAYISDPRNLPAWNSAVAGVEALTQERPAVGARYLMRRELPSGPAANELEILASVPSAEFAVRTLTGPTPFTYRYTLANDGDGGTLLRLDADVELGNVIALARPAASGFVKRGIAANFATLGEVLDAR